MARVRMFGWYFFSPPSASRSAYQDLTMSVFQTQTCFGKVSAPELAIYIERLMPPHSDWHILDLVRYAYYCLLYYCQCFIFIYFNCSSMTTQHCHSCTVILLQYQIIYTIDTNILFASYSIPNVISEQSSSHPSWFTMATDHQNPATKQKQPVASNFKVQTHSQSICGVRYLSVTPAYLSLCLLSRFLFHSWSSTNRKTSKAAVMS